MEDSQEKDYSFLGNDTFPNLYDALVYERKFKSEYLESDHLRWPNTVFARALADAIQRAHKDCKNKHAVDSAIILFAL